MNARDVQADELHSIVAELWGEYSSAKVADAILAAGYSKPRTITTAEELDALAVGSVVIDRDGMALQKTNFNFSGTGWNAANGTRDIEVEELEADCFPAALVHEGDAK